MSKPRRISLSRVPSTTASVPILERHLMVDAKRDTFPRGIVNSIQEPPVPGSAPASSGLQHQVCTGRLVKSRAKCSYPYHLPYQRTSRSHLSLQCAFQSSDSDPLASGSRGRLALSRCALGPHGLSLRAQLRSYWVLSAGFAAAPAYLRTHCRRGSAQGQCEAVCPEVVTAIVRFRRPSFRCAAFPWSGYSPR